MENTEGACFVFGCETWHYTCGNFFPTHMVIPLLMHMHGALHITTAVKTLTDPQSKLHAADVFLLMVEKQLNQVLFDHFKLHCVVFQRI